MSERTGSADDAICRKVGCPMASTRHHKTRFMQPYAGFLISRRITTRSETRAWSICHPPFAPPFVWPLPSTREIGMQIRRCDYRVLQGRIVTPQFRFFSSVVMARASGVVADGKKYLGLLKSHPSVSICRHLGAVDTVLRMFAVRLARGKIMTTLAIFVLGLIVTVITGAGAILIGLQEASDPSQSRVQDLTDLERKIVGRDEKADE